MCAQEEDGELMGEIKIQSSKRRISVLITSNKIYFSKASASVFLPSSPSLIVLALIALSGEVNENDRYGDDGHYYDDVNYDVTDDDHQHLSMGGNDDDDDDIYDETDDDNYDSLSIVRAEAQPRVDLEAAGSSGVVSDYLIIVIIVIIMVVITNIVILVITLLIIINGHQGCGQLSL